MTNVVRIEDKGNGRDEPYKNDMCYSIYPYSTNQLC